jgi:hypothetical protein
MTGMPAVTEPALTADQPLRRTAERVNAVHEWLTVTVSPAVPEGWLRCSDVNTRVIADWERRVAQSQLRNHGLTHPVAAASYVLAWYAGIASRLGGSCLLLERRVPRLGRDALAFRCHPEEHYPQAVALLDARFWCLPDDSHADHVDATVVADLSTLGAVLRAQVRTHADAFLATYRPGARLPRRDLLGAFFDGLDSGFWRDNSSDGPPLADCLALAQSVLPGGTPEFADRSSLYVVEDAAGRQHLLRRRASCCNYYRVSQNGEACLTCPRTTDQERRRRVVEPAE